MSPYYSAKFKYAILRIIGFIFHPWISDLAVRTYQHYPNKMEFFYVYRRAVEAQEKGLKYIIVEGPPTQQAPPPVPILPSGKQAPTKVVSMSNYPFKKQRKKKK